jgi:hypothetical protein
VSWDTVEKAGTAFVSRLGPAALRTVVSHAMDGWPRDAILHATPEAAGLLDALADVETAAALAYLTGIAAGPAQRAAEATVETVWSGPGSHHVPVGRPPPSWPTSSARLSGNCC